MLLYNTWNPLGLSLSEIGLDFYFESQMLSQILAFEHDREFWPIAWMPRLIHAYFFYQLCVCTDERVRLWVGPQLSGKPQN